MKKIKFLAVLLFMGTSVLFLNMKSDFLSPDVKGEPKVGDIAPEITGTTPNGKTMKLSSLKGNIVLIDFWTSWCAPCRKANKNVVKTYKKYKNKEFKNAKGFKVFNVSLDKNKGNWKAAIKIDKLDWDTHVNDIEENGDSKAANRYNVRSIPTTYLIDEEGKIIAKNLHGPMLDRQLSKLLK